MKTIKIIMLSSILFFLVLPGSASAQTRAEKESRVSKLLESKNFTFLAESANPMTGGNIRLNSASYQLSFYKDSLESFLPYFGTAFRAQFGSTQSPLMFSSGDFIYKSREIRNGGQVLTVKINKPNDPDVLTLSITPSGYGTLQVNSINRQPISFYGVIVPNEQNAN